MGELPKLVVVWLFLFLFVLPSQAQQSCQDLLNDTMAEEEGDPRAVAIVSRISDLREQWYDLLNPYGQFPIVDVEVEPILFDRSAFNVGKGIIRLGVLEAENEFADLEKKIAPVYAHEFGHALFRHNFVFHWEGRAIRYDRLVENSHAEVEKINQSFVLQKLRTDLTRIEGLLRVAKVTNSSQEWVRLKELKNQKTEELGLQVPNLFWFEKIHELTLAHNELFADSFAALFWKDPQVVAKALEPSPSDELEILEQSLLYRGHNKDVEVGPRDFRLVDFKNWKKEAAHVYTLLDPARGVLWELFMKNLPREEIPLFIKVFLAATARQFTQQIEILDSKEDFKIVPAQYNREFLRLFVEEARKQGLAIRK